MRNTVVRICICMEASTKFPCMYTEQLVDTMQVLFSALSPNRAQVRGQALTRPLPPLPVGGEHVV